MPTLTFLGTGTSVGVPMLGCDCETCLSDDPRDTRYRTSSLISDGDTRVVIDTGPEFRLQALRAGLTRLDAVFLTHEHADHVAGLDDIRAFTMRTRESIPVYANELACNAIRRRFNYIWLPKIEGTNLPLMDLRELSAPVQVGNLTFEPLNVFHGSTPILAYRFGHVGYVTDVSSIPDEAKARLHGLDVLVLEALRIRPHPTHLTLQMALSLIEELSPRRAYLVHMCHSVKHERDSKELPSGVEFAYDGLEIEF
ncbi:MAG: MBL fold metallo-hydrolase [Planctomycetota bacterium]|jgi:phosphoribosyl 1,2-cyclic phosphate phosphodiesterase